MLRGSLSQDWSNVITKVAEDYNNTPLKKLGWLKPNDIKTVYDSMLVNSNRKNYNQNIYREPNYKKQIDNQKLFESNTNAIKVGSFVYLDFGENIFAKAFDVQVKHFTFH